MKTMKTKSIRARRGLLRAGLVAAALAAAAGLVCGTSDSTAGAAAPPATDATAASPGVEFALRWPKGKRYTYRLDWTRDDRAMAAGQGSGAELTGELALRGTLELRSYGLVAGATVLGLRLPSLEEHRVLVLGQSALPDRAAVDDTFRDEEALIEIDPRGHIRALRYASDAPPLFKHLVQALVTETEVVVSVAALRKGESWTVPSATARGASELRFSVLDEATPTLSRERLKYTKLALPGGAGEHALPSLRSKGTITLSPEGHVVSLSDAEELRVREGQMDLLSSRSAIEMRLLGVDEVRIEGDVEARSSGFERVFPGEFAAGGASAEAQHLAQRVDGMTREEMLGGVSAFAAVRDAPGKNRWFWRATGLLIERPEHCRDIVSRFRSAGATTATRYLLLEMLAAAGHAEAQAAMREALDSRQARASKGTEYPMMLQRLSLLEAPEVATVEFVQGLYDRATREEATNLRMASAYVLGASAGKLHRAGKPELARPFVEVLTRDISMARSSEELASLLRALGNTRMPEVFSSLAPHASDADARIRQATSAALFGIDTVESVATLLELVDDPSIPVQHAALKTLDRCTLTDRDVERLLVLVERGGLALPNDQALVELVAHHDAGASAALRILEQLSERNAEHTELHARIRALIEAKTGAMLGAASLCAPSTAAR
jgi:hypothetical protein